MVCFYIEDIVSFSLFGMLSLIRPTVAEWAQSESSETGSKKVDQWPVLKFIVIKMLFNMQIFR